jgi:hypothetical protein
MRQRGFIAGSECWKTNKRAPLRLGNGNAFRAGQIQPIQLL